MSKDYYETLELSRDCTAEDVSNAYRRLALKFHPKKNDSKSFAVNNFIFHQVAEAYEVLSDPNKRSIYDINGAEVLRKGLVDKDGHLKGSYNYGGNAFDIFEKYFGTVNPFALIKDVDRFDDEYGTMFGSAFGGKYYKDKDPLPNVNVLLDCTLEELYNGCVKKLIYEKNKLNSDNRTTNLIKEEMDIEVYKGYDKKTVLTFPGCGNEAPGQKTSDLKVTITEVKHPVFKRVNENDLICTQKLTLIQALNSEPIKIITLDDRKLSITMDEIISPQTVKIVKGEGMPIYNKDNPLQNILFKEKKGDLYIKFDIIFPKFIDPEKKEEIIRLLEEK